MGIVFHRNIDSLLLILSILYTIILCLITTMSLVFSELQDSEIVYYIEIYGVIWITFEIIINFVRTSSNKGEKIIHLK